MPVTVFHELTATTPDNTSYEIRPSHWNSSHSASLAISGSEIIGAFGNQGNVTFGLDNNGLVTASAPDGGGGGSPAFSNGVSTGGNTAGATGTVSNQVVLVGGNNITLSQQSGINGATVTVIGGTAANAPVNVSAGSTSNNLATINFSNQNGVSFGLNGSTITASINTSQSTQPVAISGSNGSLNFSTLTMGNLNGLSHYISNGSLVGSYTVPTQSVQTQNTMQLNGLTGVVSLANANGVTFGVNGSTITASVAPGGGGGVAVSASNSSMSSGTVSFDHGLLGNVTFGLNAGTLTANAPVSSVISGTNFVQGNTTGQSSSSSYLQSSLNISAAGLISVGWSAGSLVISAPATTAVTLLSQISAGTTSNALGQLVFSNSNGVSFGLNGSTITASAAGGGAGGIALVGSNSTYTTGSVTLTGAGAITVSGGASIISVSGPALSSLSGIGGMTVSTAGSTIYVSAPAISSLSATGIVSVSINGSTISIGAPAVSHGASTGGNTAGNTGTVSGQLVLVGGNNITLSQATAVGGAATITVVGGTAANAPINLSAGTTSNNLATLVFSNSNGVSFGLNGSTITGSVVAGAAALSGYALGNTTGQSSSSSLGGTLSVSATGGISAGYSAGALLLSVATQSNQTEGRYALGNTTGQSSSSTFDARTLSISGAGGVSVGYSGNALIISGAAGGGGGGPTLAAVGGSQSTGTISFANGGGVSFGLNAGTMTGSINPSASLYALGNTTQNSSTVLNLSVLSFNALGAATWGFSNGSIDVSVPNSSSLSATGIVSLSANGNTISIGAPAFTAGVSGGNTSNTSGTVSNGFVLAGGNNITLSASTNASGMSVTVSAANAGGAQTGISGLQVSNTTYTSGTLTFQNANGISFGSSGANGISASYTVPTQSIGVSGGNTLGTSGTYSGQVVFAGGNNITLSVATAAGGAQSITISGANAGGAQTGISGLQVSNTTYTSGTLTFQNANGISFGSSGANGISASYTVPAPQTGLSGLQVSNTTYSSGTVTFQNANGISFGSSGANGISASYTVPVQDSQGMSNIGNTTGTTGMVTGRLVLAGGNGITLSGSTNAGSMTITFLGLGTQLSLMNALPWDVSTQTQIGQNSVQVFPMIGVVPFSASRADVLISNSMSSSAGSSHAGGISLYMGLYTRNGSTLSMASSGSQTYAWTDTTGGSQSLLTGLRALSVPLNVNFTGGDVWAAIASSTSSAGNNWFTASNIVLQPPVNDQLQGLLGVASTVTAQYLPGFGLYSTTGTIPASIGLSQITGLGAATQGGNAYPSLIRFANVTA